MGLLSGILQVLCAVDMRVCRNMDMACPPQGAAWPGDRICLPRRTEEYLGVHT